ncbi:hypothetical protein [Psittacicella hinzii]|uniref:Porin n=1 Tax=Psittacicella hinzii TaxID=2028575 RepID=A0A3A1YPG0_9GAMM|nr:hypothetical protein [Psittacicella hinzii]RIY39386.1 hypothetical protein CKF58_02290 [Psittacicella hinzii]
MKKNLLALALASAVAMSFSTTSAAYTLGTTGDNTFFTNISAVYYNAYKNSVTKAQDTKEKTSRTAYSQNALQLNFGLGLNGRIDSIEVGAYYAFEKTFAARRTFSYNYVTQAHSADEYTYDHYSPYVSDAWVYFGNKEYATLYLGYYGLKDAANQYQLANPTTYVRGTTTAFDTVNRFSLDHRDLTTLASLPSDSDNSVHGGLTSKFGVNYRALRLDSTFNRPGHLFSFSYADTRNTQNKTAGNSYEQQTALVYSYTFAQRYTLGVTGSFQRLARPTNGNSGKIGENKSRSVDLFANVYAYKSDDNYVKVAGSYGRAKSHYPYSSTQDLKRKYTAYNLYTEVNFGRYSGSLGYSQVKEKLTYNGDVEYRKEKTFFATSYVTLYSKRSLSFYTGAEASVTKYAAREAASEYSYKRVAGVLGAKF